MSNNDLKQFTKEIFRVAFKKFVRRTIYTISPDELWSADLVDMSNVKFHNKQTTFLLNIVDVNSRFAYSFPLKSKSGESILNALKTLTRYPRYLWVDEGKEFYNKGVKDWCKEHNIKMYSTNSGLKSVFVERFNRTMKEAYFLLWKYGQSL
jgi:transposase InsO family protein